VILKNGRSFLELFLRRSRAVHALFSAHRDPAMQTLHTLQKATRQLQSICSYGKIRRDKTLSSEAPYLKRALERLIYDMKDMASENRCLGAVWVGTLKHRHIDGSEVRASDDEAAYEDEDEEEEQSDLGKIPDEEEEEEEEDDDEEGEQEEASTGPESKDAGNGRLGSSSSNSSRLPNKRPLDDLDASYREPMPPLPRRPRRVVDSSEESSNDS
jgi:Fanconi anemia group D2 protein